MILGCTGHRLHVLPGYRGDGSSQKLRAVLLELAMEKLDQWSPDTVISGMATGWDMAVAGAAMLLGIPYRAYVPFEGQDRLWSQTDRTAYRTLLEGADDVRVFSSVERKAAYLERDMATVDDSSRLLALYCGDPRSGTGITLRYADGWLVPWTNVAEEFMRRLT